MSPNDYTVKRGDPVQPFVEKLLRDLPKIFQPFTTSANVRLQRTPHGVNVVAHDTAKPYVPRFFVATSNKRVTVGAGYVAIDQVPVMPTIKGVPLDGVMPDGKTKPIPTVGITAGPNEDLRSFVCLQVTVTPDGRVDLENQKDAVTIVHTNTMQPPSSLIGWQPLALLVWRDKENVSRVHQIVMHNLNHRFRRGAGAGGSHFFWAV